MNRELDSHGHEGVYLAKLPSPEPYDDHSRFVIAIVADSQEEAAKIARRHGAEVLALHDGPLAYRVVRE